MPVFLVFNELSVAGVLPDVTVAKRYLDEFSEILLDRRVPARRVFVTPPAFRGAQIGVGYSVGRWLSEYGSGDVEKRQRMKLLLDRSIEYLACVPASDHESTEIEYKCGGREARGLPTALLADGLAVSLGSADEWNTMSVTIEKFWIESEDVKSAEHVVSHASRPDHFCGLAEWLLRAQSPMPTTGADLWRERAGLFPSLDFCECVEKQIVGLLGNKPRFRAVVRGLQELQSYCGNWTTGNFDIHALSGASGESGPTLKMYSEERTFLCPDGQYQLFEWHLKKSDNTRIHFFDLPAHKRILVGYVGAHLRISSE